MNDKKSFSFNLNWATAMSEFPPEVRFAIYEMIIHYAATGEIKQDVPETAKVAFCFIKAEMDDDSIEYDAKCEARKKNGSKGGRPKKQMPTYAEDAPENRDCAIQEIPKSEEQNTPYVTSTGSDIVQEAEIIERSPVGEELAKPPKAPKKKTEIDMMFVRNDFIPVVNEWLQYKKERGQTYKQKGFDAFYSTLMDLSQGDPDKARRIIQQSMANNWAGIFALKNTNSDGKITANQPPTPEELDRAVAEGLARAYTRQEWE